MNGVMHFSVLDGWWVEGYQEDAGWALPQERTYEDQLYQNELDAATIYATIENEIAPAYYNFNDRTHISKEWVGYIKNTIAKVASNFTTNRMLTDYCNQYYLPQAQRYERLSVNGNAEAKAIASWKRFVLQEWDNIRVVSCQQPDASYIVSKHDPIQGEVVLDLGRLRPEDIGVEMIFATTDAKGNPHIQETVQYNLASYENNLAKYAVKVEPERTGMYQVGIRMYAHNPALPHRQDFPLVKWL